MVMVMAMMAMLIIIIFGNNGNSDHYGDSIDICRTISGPGAVHPGYVIFSSLDNVYIKVSHDHQ